MNRLQRDDGVTLAFQVRNPQAAGVPLLLTHGFGATAGMWSGNVDALSVDRPVIVWDQRGHGSSAHPTTWPVQRTDQRRRHGGHSRRRGC